MTAHARAYMFALEKKCIHKNIRPFKCKVIGCKERFHAPSQRASHFRYFHKLEFHDEQEQKKKNQLRKLRKKNKN